MQTDKTNTYLEFISGEYEELKRSINIESLKRFNIEMDCDIFHDTILKCIEKIKYEELTVKQVINYVFVSYFTNYIRDKKYARNAYKTDTEITELNGGICDGTGIDYKLMVEDLEREFGEENVEKFFKWVDGSSVREINEEYGTKNFRYTLEKIRKYIKSAM